MPRSPLPTRLFGVLLWSLAMPAFAAGPVTDLAEEADFQFERGVDAYEKGNYGEALEHLLASNRLAPNKNVVFNIARCYEQMGRNTEAWRHYASYLAAETDPTERAAAEAALKRIGPKVALVRVTTDPPGATLFVDREDLGARGTTPLVLAVSPGEHTMIAELDTYKEVRSDKVNAALGKTVELTLPMEAILGTVDLQGPPGATPATVHLDREDGPVLGTFPGQVKTRPGPHIFVLTAPGYKPTSVVVDVKQDQVTTSQVQLDPITGIVVVNTPQNGALVEVDGAASGFTPAVLPAVPVGRHRVKVSIPGYEVYEGEVDVKQQEQVVIEARLRPITEVVAASRLAQAIESAPASVSIVTAEEIRTFGYQSVYDALSGTRGLYPSWDRSYEYIGFRGYSRLGSYNNRQLMTMDGHTLNDDQLGASYYGRDLMTDLGDLERIEVVRGPGSALYGTNAFSGVVNLVTRSKATTNAPHVSGAVTGARDGRLNVGYSAQNKAGSGFWLSGGGVLSQGEDYEFPELAVEYADAEDPAYVTDGSSVNADHMWSATFNGRAWTGDFGWSGYANTRYKQIPTASYDSILADPRTKTQDSRAMTELRYEPKLGEKAQLFARVYLDHYEYDGTYAYGDTSNTSAQWDGTWAGAEARVVGNATPWLRFTGGAEVRDHFLANLRSCDRTDLDTRSCDPGEKAVNLVYVDTDPTFFVGSGYAVVDLTTKVVDAQVGARLDYFSTVGPSFNPRAALIVRPNRDNTVKLLAGSAFRAPSPYELYFEDGQSQVAADSLTPETMKTAELEYSHAFSELVTGTASVFYNQIDNVIDTAEVQVEGEEEAWFQYTNVSGTTRTAGAEVELRRAWELGYMLTTSYSFQQTREGDLFGDKTLTNSPAHLVAVKFANPLGPASLANRVMVESPRETNAGAETEWAIVWDATLSGAFRAAKLDWQVGVRNVLDWQYAHPSGPDLAIDTVPQPGRTFFGALSRSF